MRSWQANKSTIGKILLGLSFIYVLFSRLLATRPNQEITAPTLLLPSDQVFSISNSSDIISHLNHHCTHQRKIMIGRPWHFRDAFRTCKIRDGMFEQECHSEKEDFKPVERYGYVHESTTTTATCNPPQLISEESMNAENDQEARIQHRGVFGKPWHRKIDADSFTLVGTMRI